MSGRGRNGYAKKVNRNCYEGSGSCVVCAVFICVVDAKKIRQRKRDSKLHTQDIAQGLVLVTSIFAIRRKDVLFAHATQSLPRERAFSAAQARQFGVQSCFGWF
jgi:hypothetical protein